MKYVNALYCCMIYFNSFRQQIMMNYRLGIMKFSKGVYLKKTDDSSLAFHPKTYAHCYLLFYYTFNVYIHDQFH